MESKKKRIKIPEKTAAELIYKSDFKCCVCQVKGVHIHHLDENPSNNTIDNLAFLCFDHHDSASIKNSLGRKLTKDAIISYRTHHYQVIENRRKKELGEFNKEIASLNEETLLKIALNANIIIELEKIKAKYYESEKENRANILGEIAIFGDHSNNRIALEIYNFLSLVSAKTRNDITESEVIEIGSLIGTFHPNFEEDKNKKDSIILLNEAVGIGFNIVYDSIIYLKSLRIAMWGLSIIKEAYINAKRHKIGEIEKKVKDTYSDLYHHIERPERKDLGDSKELLKIFEKDLDEPGLTFPVLPEWLYNKTIWKV